MEDSVAVIGEALIDVVDGRPHVGGSPLNVAVGLARLGLATTLYSRIGADPYGDLIVDHLLRAGVTLGDGFVDSGRTSSAIATLDAEGRATYEFDLEWSIRQPDVGGVRMIHTGSIGAIREPGGSIARQTVRGAGPGVLRSFDPNVRPAVMGPAETVRERVRQCAADCHVVKLSDDDAEWLSAGAGPDAVLQSISDSGVRFVVMTRGADGCSAIVDGVRYHEPSRAVAVADTIGAGDAFMSGLLYGLVRNGCDRLLVDGAAVPSAQVRRVLATAAAVAAVTVSRAGANPPTLPELEDVVELD